MKANRYIDMTVTESKYQVEVLRPKYMKGLLAEREQKAYLEIKQEISRREQTAIDLKPEQGKLFE